MILNLPLTEKFPLLALALSFSATLFAAAPDASDNKYLWHKGDVLRFDYQRTIDTVAENASDNDETPKEHVFSFSGVLIIEVKTQDANGGSGFLRFDSPHVEMPESYWFQSMFDKPQLEKDKAKQMCRAIEGAIKAQRWTVTLNKSGTIGIVNRQKVTEEWLREESKVGGWRGRFNKVWLDVVENQLGMKATGEDRELLLSFAPLPAPAPESSVVAVAGNSATPIRPVRSEATLDRTDDCKTTYTFKRVLPGDVAKGYSFVNLSPGTANVTMKLLPEITNVKGSATFDSKLGLDKLDEDYSFKLDYTCLLERQKFVLHQTVIVRYSLNRLFPAVRTCDEPVLRGQ